MIITDIFESHQQCPECGGPAFTDLVLAEKKDACYYKVKASAKVWPSAYASGRLVQCRKKGADNYGKSKNEGVAEMDSQQPTGRIKPDGTRSHSTYGSRDHYSLGDPETTLGPDSVLTAKDVAKKASQTLNKVFGKSHKKGMAEGLNEFAPPGSNDSGNDGFSEETLKRLAAQWYNGDEDPRVERTLMAAGWEIGQDEGYDDEPGVFVVQSGDVNGSSYISWPAHELKQGVAEDQDPVAAFLARGGQIQKGKLHKPRKGELWQGSSHIGAAGGRGSKGRVTGLAANTNPKGGKPVVSAESADSGEYDYEGDMAKDDLQTMVRAARRLNGMLDDNENMPEWVQSKINKAADYVDTAADYIESNQDEQGMAEGSLEEYGDTPKGQKMLGKVHHRAADRVTSKKSDTDPAYARKAQQTQDRAWERLAVKEQGVAEGNNEKIAGRHDPDDFDDMVARVKKLAGLGPLKTVYDPKKRVYRNVPVAQQPNKK